MTNYSDVVKESIKEHKSGWTKIPDHPYKILITGGSRSGKTNSLFNVINQLSDIDKVYFYAKDPLEAKDQFLINRI